MRLFNSPSRWIGLLFATALLGTPQMALAQDAPKEDVSFESVDGVDLKGTYYPGQGINLNPKKLPCVLLLHRWGSDRTKGDWDVMAKEMQKKGYSVLAFDFRGHGKSKELKNQIKFWNINLLPFQKFTGAGRINPSKLPLRIDQKQFSKLYFPYLVNDIAAARRFLDLKNDAGELNSGRLVIIGECEMASLAMLWMATEYQRYGIAPLNGNQPTDHMGGEDIAGSVFLSIERKPLGLAMPWDQAPRLWYTTNGEIGDPVRVRSSMAFMFGEKDAKGRTDAEWFYSNLWTANKIPKADQIKYLFPIAGTTLIGGKLLGNEALGTQKAIFGYLDEMLIKRDRGKNWILRNVSQGNLELVDLQRVGYPPVPR